MTIQFIDEVCIGPSAAVELATAKIIDSMQKKLDEVVMLSDVAKVRYTNADWKSDCKSNEIKEYNATVAKWVYEDQRVGVLCGLNERYYLNVELRDGYVSSFIIPAFSDVDSTISSIQKTNGKGFKRV